jgi:hypothetical protein
MLSKIAKKLPIYCMSLHIYFVNKTKELSLIPLEIGCIFKKRVFQCFLTIKVLYIGRYIKFPCASLPNSQAPMLCTWQIAELHIIGKYRPLPLFKTYLPGQRTGQATI